VGCKEVGSSQVRKQNKIWRKHIMKNVSVWNLLVVAVAVLMWVANASAQAAAPPGGGAAPAGGSSTVQVQLWHAFVPLFAPAYTISTLTPDAAITVTRIQVQLPNAPSASCKTAAVLEVNQAGATPAYLTISSAADDSGSISDSFAASVPITLSVSTGAQCGFFGWPALGNVIVQFSTSSSGGGKAAAPAGASPAPAAPAGT
jgi:hypothetical protein